MKKIFAIVCVAFAGLCASAQSAGDMAVGVNIGVAPCLESGADVTNFGIGAKFQYNVTDPIRVEAAFDYGFKSKEVDVLTLGINAHYIFKVGEKLNVYPVVGLGYAHLKGGYSVADVDWEQVMDDALNGYPSFDYDDEDVDYVESSSSLNRFMFNIGAGVEYNLTDKLAVGAEIKYQYIKDFNRMPISVGVTYKF